MYEIYLRPKKNNYMFLRHRLHHLQPPHQKFSLYFQYLHKKLSVLYQLSVNWAAICRHFVCFGWLVDFWCTHWFAAHTKSLKFQEITRIPLIYNKKKSVQK